MHFKQTGIEELILKNANEHDPQYTYDAWDNDELLLGSRFRNPSAGGALYHESNYTAGRWRFTAGLRQSMTVQSGWGTALCSALRRAKRRASGS